MVCLQGGLSSGWSFTTVVYHRKVFHHGVPTILALAVATIIADFADIIMMSVCGRLGGYYSCQDVECLPPIL